MEWKLKDKLKNNYGKKGIKKKKKRKSRGNGNSGCKRERRKNFEREKRGKKN